MQDIDGNCHEFGHLAKWNIDAVDYRLHMYCYVILWLLCFLLYTLCRKSVLTIDLTWYYKGLSYEEQLNKNGSNNLHWMRRLLATSNSTWYITYYQVFFLFVLSPLCCLLFCGEISSKIIRLICFLFYILFLLQSISVSPKIILPFNQGTWFLFLWFSCTNFLICYIHWLVFRKWSIDMT